MPSPTPAISLGGGWPFEGAAFALAPQGSQFSFLLGQEADGSFRLVQTSGGVVQTSGGSSGGTFTDASVAPDGPSAAQPTSATQIGFWNGAGFVPAQTGQPLPVADPVIAAAQAGAGLKVQGTIADSNSAAYQGVVTISSGTATTPLRGLAFLCTAGGNITLTLADSSTMTFPIAASSNLQVLGFAVSNVALGTGTAGTFWGCK